MKKRTLANGLTVIHYPVRGKSVAVNAHIRIGSSYESPKVFGISHYIEHMLFEGTGTRSSLDIARAIEGLGGEINAYTTNERTCFMVKSLKRHIDSSLEILSDILKNPAFDEQKIDKERTIILSEVSLRRDQPANYQWELFIKAAFRNTPAGHPTIGYENTVKNIRKADLLGFFRKHYIPNNMIITVVGDLKDPFGLIGRHFGDMARVSLERKKLMIHDNLKRCSIQKDKREISQTYTVIGYPVARFSDRDSTVLEVIRAILGKGLSGKLFDEIRSKRGLGYDVGAHYEASNSFGFFACYVSSEPQNIAECERIIHEELRDVADVTDKELEEAKNYLEGEFIFDNESVEKLADSLSMWESVGLLEEFKDAVKDIRKVSRADIRRVVKRYFTGSYAKAVIYNPALQD